MKRWVMITVVLAAAVGIGAQAFREIGTVVMEGGIRWANNVETNIAGYNVYLSATNVLNFTKAATVTTNRWPGDATRSIAGWRAIYVTAFNTNGEESDPSEKGLVFFKAGTPTAVTGLGIYQVITAAATNAVPPLPSP